MISIITPSIRPEGLVVVQNCLREQTFQDFEWLVELGTGKKHDLNAAFNRMIKRAKGDLLVFYQDYIKIEVDGLEKFWKAYEANPDTLFTAPVGKTTNWRDIEWDWRAHPAAEVDWRRWEIDWASAPKRAMYDVGGFDEWLDEKTWTFDNVNVGCRIDLLGTYKFGRLIDNKAVAYDHDKFTPHPFRENFNPNFHNQRLREFQMGLKVDYLK